MHSTHMVVATGFRPAARRSAAPGRTGTRSTTGPVTVWRRLVSRRTRGTDGADVFVAPHHELPVPFC